MNRFKGYQDEVAAMGVEFQQPVGSGPDAMDDFDANGDEMNKKKFNFADLSTGLANVLTL